MALNLEKISAIAKSSSDETTRKAQERRKKRGQLHKSQEIALALHYYLRMKQMTQRDLADKMGVSPAYVGKLLKGQENLTLETISNIESAIG